MIFKWKRRFWMYRMTRVGALNVRGVHCVHMLRDKVCHGSDGAFRFLAHWKSQVQWWFFFVCRYKQNSKLTGNAFCMSRRNYMLFFQTPSFTFYVSPLSGPPPLTRCVYRTTFVLIYILSAYTAHLSSVAVVFFIVPRSPCYMWSTWIFTICPGNIISASFSWHLFHRPPAFRVRPSYPQFPLQFLRARWIVVFAAVI